MPSELTPKQQWGEQIRAAKSILILAHANPDGDALGSTLALRLGLEKLGKHVMVAIGGEIPETFSYLPGFTKIEHQPNLSKDLLVVLDESQAKVGNISLKRVSETKLIIVVTPKNGILTPANVRLEEGSFNTDLIIVLDSTDFDRLGSIYEDNASLFYEVPVINVDHHVSNTNFGKINIVDVTASSTAELLVSLLETLGKDVQGGILDENIATCLLTGLITDTGSFQNGNTTPKSLTVAAQMVAAGAHQQEIIGRVFKTRSLSTLRLWGRALSYLKEDKPLRFVWSTLSKADYVASQATTDESSGVIDELLKTAAGMDFVLLLTERDNGVHGSFRSIAPNVNVESLASLYGGGGHPQAAAFSIANSTIAQQEQDILTTLRNHLISHQTPTTA